MSVSVILGKHCGLETCESVSEVVLGNSNSRVCNTEEALGNPNQQATVARMKFCDPWPEDGKLLRPESGHSRRHQS